MKDVQTLLKVIELEQIEENIFRGESHSIGSKRVFGGQVLSQALDAAIRTVPEERQAHSMHGYFILPGDVTKPIVFNVDRIRDGGSFTTRRVVAIQNGRAIFNMSASFQLVQAGLDHQIERPDVTPPEELANDQQLLEQCQDELPEIYRRILGQRPIEFRPVDPMVFLKPQEGKPFRHVWLKAKGQLSDSGSVHRRLLAYASDYNLLTTALGPHAVSMAEMQMASLDHALWFHRDFRIDDWLLYSLDSPSASNSRGFTRGNLFNREGVLVASVVQEGLIRRRK